MEKVVLSKKIQEAINGSKEAEEFLYSHYYECYYDLVEANQSIKNIELIYSESIRESIRKSIERKEKNIPNYIRNTLFHTVKLYNDRQVRRKSKRTGINDLVISAKTDIEARGKLIERYMYLIDSYLENADFGTDLTKEDAKQIGYLFLTEKVNNYFDSYEVLGNTKLSIYLSHAINSSYMHILIREKRKSKEFYNNNVLSELIKNDGISLEEEMVEFEYNDYVDNLPVRQPVKELLKYIPYYEQVEIATDQGLSRQIVSSKLITHKEKVKDFFK